jgi:DNA-binding IscR family transcriptional regulator
LDEKRECRFESDCLIRETFKRAEDSLYSELEKVTLREMVDRARVAGDRLKWLNINNKVET